ncbi:MAG TPA: hypothetical protein VK164_03170 [Flavobacterium sp.]|uniref:hypothetical protein n=1 Tax=Flavobacterium sp. TaxID=239 RepID=UPI002B4B3C82|nr:hypothetical protein [Flavobacterium sp.]HLO72913.1 hypothetical protein [Flavobacterium sp.]
MNIILEIKHFFQRRKALNQIFDDIKNLDEVLLNKRIEIFNEVVTPRFAEIGLTNWDGKYLWFSDFNEEGIKHVIEYNVFKVFGGSFSYGNCFEKVPTISGGNKMIYHRTNRSTKIIYYKKFPGWEKSDNENSPTNVDKISTVNETRFRETLSDVLDRNLPIVQQWFKNNQTIQQNISNLIIDQKNYKADLIQRIISFEYVLGFLFAQQKDFQSSKKWIEKHFLKKIHNEQEMNLIINKLKEFSN